jgi:hypothetical protein
VCVPIFWQIGVREFRDRDDIIHEIPGEEIISAFGNLGSRKVEETESSRFSISNSRYVKLR